MSKIISQKKVQDKYYQLVFSAPAIAKTALPGQFVNIKVRDSDEPLLRRPFGVHRIRGSNIEILYAVVGPATQILSQKKTGEDLDVIGALGKGFDMREARGQRQRAILVAGGMGVAPLIFLAQKLKEKIPNPKSQIPNLVLIGAKTKKQILCATEFKDLGYTVRIATDDGSQGFKGKVTDLLKKFLPLAISHQPLAIYACGPRLMLQEISRLSTKYKIPAQISLEEHMACGIGACFGCVVKTKKGNLRVCKEGPVFYAQEIAW